LVLIYFRANLAAQRPVANDNNNNNNNRSVGMEINAIRKEVV
jgi:hypothetical protein